MSGGFHEAGGARREREVLLLQLQGEAARVQEVADLETSANPDRSSEKISSAQRTVDQIAQGAFCVLRFAFCVLRFAFCVMRELALHDKEIQ